MDKYDNLGGGLDPQQGLRYFTGFVVLAQICGLGVVILVAVWMGNYLGGFAWHDDVNKQFNYHPLFMVIGLVFLYGNSILVYRVFRNDRKVYIKVLHAVLHAFALIFAGVGLKAVFDFHNLSIPPKANLYTLHSWIGLATVILFGLQWLMGFASFLFPGFSHEFRTRYKDLHVFWGIVIFVMAIAASLTGITEKAIFAVNKYDSFIGETYLINFIGLLLIVLGIIVVYIVTNKNFARHPLPEEEHIQLSQ